MQGSFYLLQSGSFIEEYLHFLDKFEIDYDEHYLFDPI